MDVIGDNFHLYSVIGPKITLNYTTTVWGVPPVVCVAILFTLVLSPYMYRAQDHSLHAFYYYSKFFLLTNP